MNGRTKINEQLGATTKLCLEYLGDGKWRLLKPFAIWLGAARTRYVVPMGFITDLASVPRLPFVYAACGNAGPRAAVLHDWLYATGKASRRAADWLFRQALLSYGEPAWRAWLMWLGVRIGGWVAWRRHRSKDMR